LTNTTRRDGEQAHRPLALATALPMMEVRRRRREAAMADTVELGAAARPEVSGRVGRQVASFVVIGIASTLTSLTIFLVLRIPIGPVAANVVALTTTTVANAWANRRWTFGWHGREQRLRQLGTAVAIYAVTTVVSSMAVAAVQGPVLMELIAISVTWSLATVTRFVLMRSWVFRRHPVTAG
jgi:putative flippase GtrA